MPLITHITHMMQILTYHLWCWIRWWIKTIVWAKKYVFKNIIVQRHLLKFSVVWFVEEKKSVWTIRCLLFFCWFRTKYRIKSPKPILPNEKLLRRIINFAALGFVYCLFIFVCCLVIVSLLSFGFSLLVNNIHGTPLQAREWFTRTKLK